MSSTEHPPVAAPEDPYVLGVRREIPHLDRSLVELVTTRTTRVQRLGRATDGHGV